MAVRKSKKSAVKLSGVRRMPGGLTTSKIKEHVLNPINIQVEFHDVVAHEPTFKVKRRPRPSITKKFGLDVAEFGSDLHDTLRDGAPGYAVQIRQHGATVYEKAHGFAQTSADDRLPWTVNTRMHVGSVSKLMTSIGLVRVLDRDPVLHYDSHIHPHLPVYWETGQNIRHITFRHLLSHTSGLGVLPEVGGGQSSKSNYPFMKLNVSLKTPKPPLAKSVYQNMNYGLMRILIPIIRGDIESSFKPPQSKDQTWDALTINFFKEYMQDEIFTPAGVQGAGFAPLPTAANSALAYAFPPTGFGWNSGDLQAVAGGVGWRLSVNEVLNVMDHYRRRNTYVNSTIAQQALDANFGLNRRGNTAAGHFYFKRGAWGDGARAEQAHAFFLPNEMELVLFVNSKLFVEGFNVSKVILDLYKANLR